MQTESDHPNRVSGVSGRSWGNALRKKKHVTRESRKMRAKQQLQPRGPNRFPGRGTPYRYADTGEVAR